MSFKPRRSSRISSRSADVSGSFESKLKAVFESRNTSIKEAVEEKVLGLIPRMKKMEYYKNMYTITLEISEIEEFIEPYDISNSELYDMVNSLSSNLYCVEGFWEGMAYDMDSGRVVVDVFYSTKDDNPDMERVKEDYK